MNGQKRTLNRRAGFTLLEMIIVFGLFAVVTVVIGIFSADISSLGGFVQKNLENQQDLEQVFQLIVTEIRSMAPSGTGAYPIGSASTSSLSFYVDYDKDNIVERIRYFVATSTVERGVIEPTGSPAVYATSSEVMKTVVRNVVATSTPLFRYYDANYTGAQAPLVPPIDIPSIRLIKVFVLADTNPGVTPEPTAYLRTITIRNLRNN